MTVGGGPTHRGFVHEIRLESIRVSFNGSFQMGRRYNVRFEYNRTPIKRQHQALMAQSASAQRLLFPLPQHVPLDRVIDGNEFRITMFNTRISSNAAQFQAVKSILRMKHGAAPFIIFGP